MAEIRCPKCKRFLAEVGNYGRAVCPSCGWEVTVRAKSSREGLTT